MEINLGPSADTLSVEDVLVKKLAQFKINDESSMRDLKSMLREAEAFITSSTKGSSGDCSNKTVLWNTLIKSVHSQLLSTNTADSSKETTNILVFIKAIVEMQIPQTLSFQNGELSNVRSGSGDGNSGDSLHKDYLYTVVIEPILPNIWDYIIKTLQDLSISPDLQKSSTTLHQVLGLIHKTIRTSLSILKRIDSINIQNCITLRDGTRNLKIRDSIQRYGVVLCGLLQNTSLESELDVKCSIGLGLCITYKILHGRGSYFSFFEKVFLQKESYGPKIALQATILTVSKQIVNRIALAFGVLSIVGSNYCGISVRLLKAVGQDVLSMDHGTKEAVSLGSARILESWTQKISEMELEVVFECKDLFPEIEFFLFNNMAGHIDAVKSCCRNTVGKLATIYDHMEDATNSNLVRGLLERFYSKPPHVKWTGISWIARSTSKSLCLLDMEQSLPTTLLSSERIFKNAANETYLALMSYHFDSTSTDEWIRKWVAPLFSSHKSNNTESNWSQKRTIICTILKSKNKKLTETVLKYVVTQSNSESLTCPEASQLAVEAVKIATELQIKLEISPHQNNVPDSFQGIIPRNVLNSWLWSGNPQARLAAFSIIVETKKTSEPISMYDFESLKLFIRYNLVSQNPAFRQQFLSYFKKLLRRLNDSFVYVKRKKDSESQNNYHSFFKWLWMAFTSAEGLFPGANFARRCQSLECLAELTTHFDFELLGVESSPDNLNFLSWLSDSYENNKIMGFRILEEMPMPNLKDPTFAEKLMTSAISYCGSVKPPESMTGRYLVVFIMKMSLNSYSPLSILKRLYDKLSEILSTIKLTNFMEVSGQTAIYGYLSCIRMIFAESKDYLNEHSVYREFSEKLIDICFELDQIFFPLLGSAAPEGSLILDKPGQNDSATQVVRSINAQKMLVCSWRSMRDACLLMTEMCSLFPLEGEKDEYILSYGRVEAIGNHLLFLLKNLMHRGVFEQIFVGFKLLTTRLYKSTTPNQLIETWLENAMDEDLISSKSVTRRSAGLPFILQALLAPGSSNEAFICKYLTSLFSKQSDSPQVRIHIMNVLRALFRDATFSRSIMPYVPEGLKLAFKAQANNFWPEQNSGLMLLGAVVRRTFGPILNSMSASTFFRKFPEMYDFLLEEIRSCSEKLNLEKQLIVQSSDFTFYVLVLLASFATRGVVEDAHFPLSKFIPCIRDCGASYDVRVRKIAAKALIPFLIDPANQMKTINSVLDDLSSQNLTSYQVHGHFCVILTILKTVPNQKLNLTVLNRFEQLTTYDHIWNHKSPLIFETASEICFELGQISQKFFGFVYEKFQTNFRSFNDRHTLQDLPNADRKIFEVKIFFSLTDINMNTLELVYNWILTEKLVFMEQLLSYLSVNKFSIFSEPHSSVILNALVKRYVQTNFLYDGQTTVEELFLTVLGQINEDLYIDWLNFVVENEESIVSNLFEKVVHICEMESGTVSCKAKGVELLGKLAFKIPTKLSEEHQDRLCQTLSLLCDSKSSDEIRFGVAKCLPVLEQVDNFKVFTVNQQCKLWYIVIALAQDDESFIREEINLKLNSTFGSIACDIKLIENMIQLFFTNFISNHINEGLTLLTGIILRDDYLVAEEADDSEEERLFDKSEINSFNEPFHVAKIVQEYLQQNLTLHKECQAVFHNMKLSHQILELYEFVSNSILASKTKTEHYTLHKICSNQITTNSKEKVCSSNILYFTQSEKHTIQNTIREFYINIFNN